MTELVVFLGLTGWVAALWLLLEIAKWKSLCIEWQGIAKRWEGMWEAQYQQTLDVIGKCNQAIDMLEVRERPKAN